MALMTTVLRYAGDSYDITPEEERELDAILDGGKGRWLSVKHGGGAMLWIDSGIPLVLTRKVSDGLTAGVSTKMYSL